MVKEKITLSESRMEICNECEFLFAGFCRQCVCLMSVKTKLKSSECPIGKWKAVEDE